MNGLVLAGGESQRMGQAKALLQYQEKAQFFCAIELLSLYCEQVYLSCRKKQGGLFLAAGYTGAFIFDQSELGAIGPLNALLSAFKTDQQDWLVLGCDYPLINNDDITQLITLHKPAYLSTVFQHPETGFEEPLIGIYSAQAEPFLWSWLQKGNQSLRFFLKEHKVQLLQPKNPLHLQSADTPADFQRLKSVISDEKQSN
jgi:molybdopterin-guanine dinucleotide biosynthesis protein A